MATWIPKQGTYRVCIRLNKEERRRNNEEVQGKVYVLYKAAACNAQRRSQEVRGGMEIRKAAVRAAALLKTI